MASPTLRPEAKETLTELLARGYQTAIITGSFSTTAEVVAHDLGIAYSLTNATPHFNEQNHLTHISVRREERIVKVEHLRTLCTTLGITSEDCATVGEAATITKLKELLPLF